VFNATFSNISAISWQPVLVVEEAGVPGENGQATDKLYHLRLRRNWSYTNMKFTCFIYIW